MRDKWVSIYILLVLAQIPIYFALGEGPLIFDFATQDAEQRINDFQDVEADGQAAELALESAHAGLQRMGDDTSRLARLRLNEGILAWKSGKPEEAVEALEDSLKIFKQKHGPDSFHVAAVDLRIAELQYLRRKYKDAADRFRRSNQRVREYLGPRHPFVVRQSFREVCTLVALGRRKEAGELARVNMTALKLVAEEQDTVFMTTTGESIDILHRQGEYVGPPPGFGNWKSYLASLSPAQQPDESSPAKPKTGTDI
jgi:tetratricopeptide (TPR) repeat protein